MWYHCNNAQLVLYKSHDLLSNEIVQKIMFYDIALKWLNKLHVVLLKEARHNTVWFPNCMASNKSQ